MWTHLNKYSNLIGCLSNGNGSDYYFLTLYTKYSLRAPKRVAFCWVRWLPIKIHLLIPYKTEAGINDKKNWILQLSSNLPNFAFCSPTCNFEC